MHSDEDYHSYGSDADDHLHQRQPGSQVDDPEVWMDHWSEELVTLWHGLQEHAQMLGAAVLDRCDFPAFAQFCWERSSRVPPSV